MENIDESQPSSESVQNTQEKNPWEKMADEVMEDRARREENLKKFEHFFDSDLLAKKTMLDMAPEASDDYDEKTRIDYSDRLLDGVATITDIFEKMNTFVPEKYYEQLSDIEQDIINAGTNMQKLKDIYNHKVANMSPDFIKKVNSIAGYKLSNYDGEDAKTINEMLHFIHTNTINSESTLQNLPIITDDENGDGTTLFGEENENAKDIFETVKNQKNLGHIDIASLKNRILMMVRDSGHALLIEVEEGPKENGSYIVSYHVPKICNAEKVNRLPGVRKVSEDTNAKDGTSGAFQTTKETLTTDIKNFISQVPTDIDMVY